MVPPITPTPAPPFITTAPPWGTGVGPGTAGPGHSHCRGPRPHRPPRSHPCSGSTARPPTPGRGMGWGLWECVGESGGTALCDGISWARVTFGASAGAHVAGKGLPGPGGSGYWGELRLHPVGWGWEWGGFCLSAAVEDVHVCACGHVCAHQSACVRGHPSRYFGAFPPHCPLPGCGSVGAPNRAARPPWSPPLPTPAGEDPAQIRHPSPRFAAARLPPATMP